MDKYQSKERVLAVQIESVQGNLVNGEISLDNNFVSQWNLALGRWLISNGSVFTKVLDNVHFEALYELEEEETQVESDETQKGSGKKGDGKKA